MSKRNESANNERITGIAEQIRAAAISKYFSDNPEAAGRLTLSDIEHSITQYLDAAEKPHKIAATENPNLKNPLDALESAVNAEDFTLAALPWALQLDLDAQTINAKRAPIQPGDIPPTSTISIPFSQGSKGRLIDSERPLLHGRRRIERTDGLGG